MACLVLCCKWYVAKVTGSMCRFNGASTFNGDLSKWYVAKVTDSMCRFNGASTFNGDLSKWYVAKVTDMTCMVFMVLRPSTVSLACVTLQGSRA